MLGLNGRRVLLSFHIIFNAIWIGGLASILFLNLSKSGQLSGDELFSVNRMIFLLHDTVIVNIAFAVIATGMLFSLLTKWGFFDFWWILTKWTGLVVMFALIVNYLAPAVNGTAALSDIDRHSAIASPDYIYWEKQVTIFTWISLIILTGMVILSVFKPWGKRKKLFNLRHRTVVTLGSVIGILILSGGVMQYLQLQSYRHLPIKNINLARISDGVYQGEADYGFNYLVEVSVHNHNIEQIRILQNRNSFYAKLAEGIVDQVLGEQRINVDAVSGATTTSKVLLKAIETALQP